MPITHDLGLDLRLDLRLDLIGDTVGWSRLFGVAYELGTGRDSVIGVLRGVQCLGAKLERSRKSWKITPTIGSDGWENEEAWQRDRVRWLMPHKRQIARLLAELGTCVAKLQLFLVAQVLSELYFS